MYKYFINTIAVYFVLMSHSAMASKTVILTSIKPLALLTAALVPPSLADQIEIDVLLAAGVSPHHYALKVSDIKRLEQSDVFIWVGPELEVFLQRTLRNLAAPKLLTLYPNASAHDHQHEHIGDPHPWLAIAESDKMAAKISAKLSTNLPQYQALFDQQLLLFKQSLEAYKFSIKDFKHVKKPSFISMHAAFDELADDIKVESLGVWTLRPEQQAGMRHISMLKTLLASGDVNCIVTEPLVSSKNLNRLIEQGVVINRIEIDPLAQHEPLTEQAYLNYLRTSAYGLRACVTGKVLR